MPVRDLAVEPRLVRADWLAFAAALPPSSVDLLYVDPPFNTGTAKRSPPGAAQAGRTADGAYADRWPSTGAWVAWLRERLRATIPALKHSASVLLHVDWRTCHHARLLLEDLFGPASFVNHLVWSYGLGGSSPRRFARKHDDILFYALDPRRYYFDPPRVPATSRRLAGAHKKATDVLDIPAINNMALERTGYPTQKPLELLRLLVRACAPPGGTVLDPCCGSGTTLLAALLEGRAPLGCDISPVAIRTSHTRLAAARPRTIP